MPQMAPMSWMLLFMMFCIALFIFTSTNYYLYKPTMSEAQKSAQSTKKMSWKW